MIEQASLTVKLSINDIYNEILYDYGDYQRESCVKTQQGCGAALEPQAAETHCVWTDTHAWDAAVR